MIPGRAGETRSPGSTTCDVWLCITVHHLSGWLSNKQIFLLCQVKKQAKFDYYMFAFNIKLIADRNGGMKALAKNLDVTYESVRRWCNGEYLPDGQTLLTVQEKYSVSIDWLLNGAKKSGLKCPFCGDWTEDIRTACADMKEILESDDEAVRTALRSNLAAFKQSIEKNKKLHSRPKDKQNPGKRARDKALGSHSDTVPAAKSAVG